MERRCVEVIDGAEHEVMMEREVRSFVFDRAAEYYLAA